MKDTQLEIRTSALTDSNGNTSEQTNVRSEVTNVDGSNPAIDGVKDEDTKVISVDVETSFVTTDDRAKYLIYGVNDSPPIHVTIVCALQVTHICSYFQVFAIILAVNHLSPDKFRHQMTRKFLLQS